MAIIFKPKTRAESLNWFMTIPFYSLKNVFRKSPLFFNDNEITKIQKRSDSKDIYFITFSRPDFFGNFITTQLPSGGEAKLDVEPSPPLSLLNLKKMLIQNHLLRFYKYSPSITVLFLLGIIVIFIPELQNLALSTFLKTEYFFTDKCATDCALKISKSIFILIFVAAIAIVPMIVSVVFFFKISKCHRNANEFTSVRTESLILFLFSFWITISTLQISIEKDIFQKISKIPYRSVANQNPNLNQ
ncbi:MAG: hypothetical protein JNL11_01305 [Bdellovibrionaceae bacterium]|nr:hypothetical protein [Pseudobdellovibrionaceae bacterium]